MEAFEALFDVTPKTRTALEKAKLAKKRQDRCLHPHLPLQGESLVNSDHSHAQKRLQKNGDHCQAQKQSHSIKTRKPGLQRIPETAMTKSIDGSVTTKPYTRDVRVCIYVVDILLFF